MKLFNKIKWVLGILIIFLLIIFTNLIDKNNYSRVKDSVSSMYEDRIVANDLIFEISKYIHEKEVAVITLDSTYFSKSNLDSNNEVMSYITKFEKTKLAKDETTVLRELRDNLEMLKTNQKTYVSSNFSENKALMKNIYDARENLYLLSKIQLKEGQRQLSISQKAIDKIDLFTQIEIYFLIFLAIIIQIIVMYSPSKD